MSKFENLRTAEIISVNGNDIEVDKPEMLMAGGSPITGFFTIYPVNQRPDADNSEIVKIVSESSGVFTLSRQEQSSSLRTIVVGDIISNTITKLDLGGSGYNPIQVTVATSSNGQNKVGTTSAGDYVPQDGDELEVVFTNGSSAIGAVNLNIDGSGNKNIQVNGIHHAADNILFKAASGAKVRMFFNNDAYQLYGSSASAFESNKDTTVLGDKTFSNPVTVATPTADGHAATKKYVDDNSGGGGGGHVHVEDRSPDSFDDTASGYSIGDFWLDTSTNLTYLFALEDEIGAQWINITNNFNKSLGGLTDVNLYGTPPGGYIISYDENNAQYSPRPELNPLRWRGEHNSMEYYYVNDVVRALVEVSPAEYDIAHMVCIKNTSIGNNPPEDTEYWTEISEWWNARTSAGKVDSVQQGEGIEINNTDPINPEISLSSAAQSSLQLADTAVQPESLGDLAFKDKISVTDIDATGTPGSTTYYRGDGKWETPAGGGGGSAWPNQFDPGWQIHSVSITSLSTPAIFNNSNGNAQIASGMFRWSPGGNASARSFSLSGATCTLLWSKKVIFRAILQQLPPNSVLDGSRSIMIGVGRNMHGSSPSTSSGGSAIKSKNGGWEFVTRDYSSSSQTATDISSYIDSCMINNAGNSHLGSIMIAHDGVAGKVELYLDDVLVVTHSTNVLTTDDTLIFGCFVISDTRPNDSVSDYNPIALGLIQFAQEI